MKKAVFSFAASLLALGIVACSNPTGSPQMSDEQNGRQELGSELNAEGLDLSAAVELKPMFVEVLDSAQSQAQIIASLNRQLGYGPLAKTEAVGPYNSVFELPALNAGEKWAILYVQTGAGATDGTNNESSAKIHVKWEANDGSLYWSSFSLDVPNRADLRRASFCKFYYLVQPYTEAGKIITSDRVVSSFAEFACTDGWYLANFQLYEYSTKNAWYKQQANAPHPYRINAFTFNEMLDCTAVYSLFGREIAVKPTVSKSVYRSNSEIMYF